MTGGATQSSVVFLMAIATKNFTLFDFQLSALLFPRPNATAYFCFWVFVVKLKFFF